ncbi:hypothetical protein CMUS01_02947 [Colletotrichum musicola]|uniref:Uncharacterized protein n=1 Tax=Colletotrichum musicola TaxID=2175873 RepID=A0A8H6NU73_9PEZI|nr:hypothetical protein CMUS01_02947 [Colletotrichum musicola]
MNCRPRNSMGRSTAQKEQRCDLSSTFLGYSGCVPVSASASLSSESASVSAKMNGYDLALVLVLMVVVSLLSLMGRPWPGLVAYNMGFPFWKSFVRRPGVGIGLRWRGSREEGDGVEGRSGWQLDLAIALMLGARRAELSARGREDRGGEGGGDDEGEEGEDEHGANPGGSSNTIGSTQHHGLQRCVGRCRRSTAQHSAAKHGIITTGPKRSDEDQHRKPGSHLRYMGITPAGLIHGHNASSMARHWRGDEDKDEDEDEDEGNGVPCREMVGRKGCMVRYGMTR